MVCQGPKEGVFFLWTITLGKNVGIGLESICFSIVMLFILLRFQWMIHRQ